MPRWKEKGVRVNLSLCLALSCALPDGDHRTGIEPRTPTDSVLLPPFASRFLCLVEGRRFRMSGSSREGSVRDRRRKEKALSAAFRQVSSAGFVPHFTIPSSSFAHCGKVGDVAAACHSPFFIGQSLRKDWTNDCPMKNKRQPEASAGASKKPENPQQRRGTLVVLGAAALAVQRCFSRVAFLDCRLWQVDDIVLLVLTGRRRAPTEHSVMVTTSRQGDNPQYLSLHAGQDGGQTLPTLWRCQLWDCLVVPRRPFFPLRKVDCAAAATISAGPPSNRPLLLPSLR